MDRNYDQEIREVENTRRILKNVDRIVRNASIQGSEAPNVTEALQFLKWLDDSAEGNLFSIRSDRKAASKAQPAIAEVTPDVQSSEQK